LKVGPAAIGPLDGKKVTYRFLNTVFVLASPRQTQQTPTVIVIIHRLSAGKPRSS
jgi:hypothetical protein